jgi:hypothetical protein
VWGWQDVTFAPNGRHLLWDEPDGAGRRVIVLAGAMATGARIVVSDAGSDDIAGSFAPGGHRLVYVRQRAGAEGRVERLSFGAAGDGYCTGSCGYPEFLPTGNRILFIGSRGGVWTVAVNGGRAR